MKIFPVIAAVAIGFSALVAAIPAQADSDGWGREHRHEWREDGWRGRPRGDGYGYGNPYAYQPQPYYAPPPVYYAPPPVYYAPPPVYYGPPPGIGFNFVIR